MTDTWNHAQAVALCCAIEAIAPHYGCHVALTGGTLYRDGERKDADILFYRIRQAEQIDVAGLMHALRDLLGVTPARDYGWCYKATLGGRHIDFFFPERADVVAPPGYDGRPVRDVVRAETVSVAEALGGGWFREEVQ